MKTNDKKQPMSMTVRVLAGVLAAFLIFGSVAGVLFYILA